MSCLLVFFLRVSKKSRVFLKGKERAAFGRQGRFSVGCALCGLALKAPPWGTLRTCTPSKK